MTDTAREAAIERVVNEVALTLFWAAKMHKYGWTEESWLIEAQAAEPRLRLLLGGDENTDRRPLSEVVADLRAVTAKYCPNLAAEFMADRAEEAALTDPRQPSEEHAALTELHDAVCKATDGHSWPGYLWAAINRTRGLIREKK
jgi:hypothetical protein